MKIRLLIFLMSTSMSVTTFAQLNLVPNPDFEDTLGCPQFYPDLDGVCAEWTSFRITPDYFHYCSLVCGFYNQAGHQEPHSGQGYAGIATYHVNIPDAREHVAVQLIAPLTVGLRYYISFYVSPGFNVQANIVTDKIGALVTTYPYYDQNGDNSLPNASTIYTDSIISDTTVWRQIFGSFVADSAYQYLIIGSFFDDANVDTLHLPSLQFGNYVSYYFLDDVCVSTDSMYASDWTNILSPGPCEMEMGVYPNPSNNTVNVTTCRPIEKIILFNSTGQQVLTLGELSANVYTIDVSTLPPGVYYIHVETMSTTMISPIIINP